MNNLIGVSGKINSGKDLVGQLLNYLATGGETTYVSLEGFLEYYYDGYRDGYCMYPYKIKKFADKLKEMVCLLIGCTREQLEDREFKETPLGKEWDIIVNLKGELVTQELNPNIFKERKTTPRLLLQLLGTNCGRKIIHPNIWCNALFADYNPIFVEGVPKNPSNWEIIDPILGKLEVITPKANYPKWIITDVRFPNEAKAIKDRGGIIIRINRPCKECHGLGFHKMDCGIGVLEHESEYSLDKYDNFDYIIDNDGSIQDLVDKIKKLNLV